MSTSVSLCIYVRMCLYVSLCCACEVWGVCACVCACVHTYAHVCLCACVNSDRTEVGPVSGSPKHPRMVQKIYLTLVTRVSPPVSSPFTLL